MEAQEAAERLIDRPGKVDTDDGWQGTEPAEGTRRRLIRNLLAGKAVTLTSGRGGLLDNGSALRLADKIEEALCRWVHLSEEYAARLKEQEANDGETLIQVLRRTLDISGSMSAEGLRARIFHVFSDFGISSPAERQVREYREEHEEAHHILDMLGVPKGPEISPPTVLNRLRDLHADRLEGKEGPWEDITSLTAITGSKGLESLTVLYQGEKIRLVPEPVDDYTDEDIEDIVEDVYDHVRAEFADEKNPPASPDLPPDTDDLNDYERRLLGEREEARASEGRCAEERDCAFALLRWLLPVTVAKRID